MVATRSGEAEFSALTKSASRAPRAVFLVTDMAKELKPTGANRCKRVERDGFTMQIWSSETLAYSSPVGTRGSGATRADSRASTGM